MKILISVAVITLAAIGLDSAGESKKQISLTFDDAPRGDGPFMTGEERATALIQALASVDVEGAMFFVTTRNMEQRGEEGEARIRRYVEAGHTLANHSHSHLWFHRTDTDEYIADLDKAIERLEAFDGVTNFYRFPFLDEGREAGKRDAFREALAVRGLKNGYVTIDDYDWFMVTLAAEAKEADTNLDMDALRDAYVELLVDAANFYDTMAVETIGRSPRHVLLLHENDLAAMFIDDLVRALRADGWEIIPATDAFTDPIANHEPDTLFLGQGRIAAMAHEAGKKPRDLVHVTEDEEALRAEFVRRGLLPAE